MESNETKKIRDSFASVGILLSEEQADQFFSYYLFLKEKNKAMNLTSITEFDEVVKKHFLDSVLPAAAFDLDSHHFVIDVGTGAGFPGIPLKICFPEIELVLLDSQNKRVQFLNDLSRRLQLSSVTVVHARAEDAAREVCYREHFDLCVSRAVANLAVLSEYCLPFVKREGLFAAYKAAGCERECEDAAEAIKILGGGETIIRPLVLPGSKLDHTIVLIRKEKDTPSKFPRKAGIPMKRPLHSSSLLL